MKFLLDENADIRLIPFLTELGHDVTAVARDYPTALDDATILSIALNEGRVIIAGDTDFGDLIHRQHRQHAGVIMLRLRARGLWHLKARLSQVLDRLTSEPQFLVVTDHRTRAR